MVPEAHEETNTMCMFMGPAKVARTRIFATRQGSQQILVYEARVDSAAPNAMMLPVPVAADDSRIELIDLQAWPKFFDDLYARYVTPAFGGPGPSTLEVFRVGAYEASAQGAQLDSRRAPHGPPVGEVVRGLPPWAPQGIPPEWCARSNGDMVTLTLLQGVLNT